MKIDEKVNNENIKLFERYGLSYCEKNMYTCICCGKKTSIDDSCSIGGAYLVCGRCAYDKFGSWHNCRKWQEKMLGGDEEDE